MFYSHEDDAKNESKLFKAKILRDFTFNFQKEIEQMKNCFHYYDEETPNIFHLENDVWTHSMLVFNSIKIPRSDYIDGYANCIIALTHDYGKVYKRKENAKKSRVFFHGHAEASTYFTFKVVKTLFRELLNNKDFEELLDKCLTVVSNHDNVYKVVNDSKDMVELAGRNLDIFYLFKSLAYADCDGQYVLNKEDVGKFEKCKDKFSNYVEYIKMYKHVEESDIPVWIYCGLPGSGKDYAAMQNGLEVVSYDDIRVEEYVKNNKDATKDKSQQQIYAAAWQWANSKNLDLNRILKSKLNDAKQRNVKVAICNMNLTLKVRQDIMKLVRSVYGDSKVGAHIFMTDVNICIKRDKSRESKNVGAHVIHSKSKNVLIPTMLEGFSTVNKTFTI